MRNTYFGLSLIVFLSITSSGDLSAQSPSTAAPPQLLAAPTPTPIYFLTKGVWLTIRGKTYGFGTGTQFELVQDSGNRIRVKNGDYEFEVDRALVTNDIAVAKQAYETEIAEGKAREQEEITQAQKAQAQEQAKIELKKLSDAELEQLIQRRAEQQPGSQFAAWWLQEKEQREREKQAARVAARQAEQQRDGGQDGQDRRAQTQEIEAPYERMLRNTRIMRAAEDQQDRDDQRKASIMRAAKDQQDRDDQRKASEFARQQQAEWWRAEKARDRIQDLQRQVSEAKRDVQDLQRLRDEMYEYNKGATERGNSAAERVGQSYDSKIHEIHDLEGKINDVRNEHYSQP